MNILDKLKDNDDFTESEIEIATFILKNTDLVCIVQFLSWHFIHIHHRLQLLDFVKN